MNRAFFFASVLALATLPAGCSLVVDSTFRDDVDSGTPGLDGGDRDAGETPDGGPPTDTCARFPDGTACTVDGIAEPLVCNGGRCELSRCGDGVHDRRSEACDDGNDAMGDGCDNACTFSCDTAVSCDDGIVCNGAEQCVDHRCEAGVAVEDGTSCDDAGMCRAGVCVPVGCGNGAVEGTEDCEPPTIGCRADCSWECESNDDCSAGDTDACDGVGACDVDSHTCQPGTPLECPDTDMNACTIDSCDPVLGCVADDRTNDSDGDGHFAQSCGGDDCDDADATSYPGSSEICGDRRDNDCNGAIDDTASVWYADCDSDTYAASGAESVVGCDQPTTTPTCIGATGARATWTLRAPIGTDVDCYDFDASARPGQVGWFSSTHGGGSYDWNCSGRSDIRYPLLTTESDTRCSGTLGRCSGETYYTVRPSCGRDNTLSYCGGLTCARTTMATTTECH